MSEMITRVAESQAHFDGRSLMAMPKGERDRYMARARAAIESMREPTPSMVSEGEDVPIGGRYCGSYGAKRVFTAMIDAALQEKEAGE